LKEEQALVEGAHSIDIDVAVVLNTPHYTNYMLAENIEIADNFDEVSALDRRMNRRIADIDLNYL
jgi:hypothetical protein